MRPIDLGDGFWLEVRPIDAVEATLKDAQGRIAKKIFVVVPNDTLGTRMRGWIRSRVVAALIRKGADRAQ